MIGEVVTPGAPTAWFKRIRQVLRLSRRDVVEVMAWGGEIITPSQADGWSRRHGDDRAVDMGIEQFDRFTVGVVEWNHRNRSKI